MWLHKLGTDQANDSCLYHEKDDTLTLDLEASESKKYLFVSSNSKTTGFIFYLDISRPEDGLKVLTPRLDGIDTSASHRGNHFFIRRRSDEVFNSEVLACPVENISATTVLIPHRQRLKSLFSYYWALLLLYYLSSFMKFMVFLDQSIC